MIISTDAKNLLDKIQHSFMNEKSLSKLEKEGNLFILINKIYKNLTGKIGNVFPLR